MIKKIVKVIAKIKELVRKVKEKVKLIAILIIKRLNLKKKIII